MRLREVAVHAVLGYDGLALDLDGEGADLHLIFGPNEAGKSTLLQLIIDLLFGGVIAAGARDAYRSGSCLEGVVEQPGHEPLRLYRKRQRTRLVLQSDPELAEEDFRFRYLGGYDRDRFALLFGFDHQRLREGGISLLQSGGHAGVSLFEAGTGLQYLQDVLKDLAERAESLLDPGFRGNANRVVNKAWRGYQEAERNIRRLSLGGDAWQRQASEVRRLEEHLVQLQRSVQDWERERLRLQRVSRVQSGLRELGEIRRRLAAIGEVTPLSASDGEKIVQNLASARELTGKLADQRREDERLHARLQAITIDSTVLAADAEIDALAEGVRQYVTIRDEELPQVQTLRQDRQRRIDDALKSLAPGIELAAVETLRIPLSEQDHIESLAEAVQEAKSNLQKDETHHQELLLQQEHVTKALAVADELPETAELRDLVDAIRNQGDLDALIEQRRRQMARQRASLESLWTGQGVWTGRLEEAGGLPVPLPETVDRYALAWAEREQALRDLRQERSNAERALADVQRDLQMLESAGRVPIPEDLERARAERDQGWQLVKRAWLYGEADVDAIGAFAGTMPLDEAFEAALGEADGVADGMWQDAERSGRRNQLLQRRQQIEGELEELAGQDHEQKKALASLAADWQGEWQASAITAKSPAEMKEFLAAVYRPAVEGLRIVGDQVAEIDGLVGRRQHFRQALADLGKRLGISLPASASLKTWLARAETWLRAVDERVAERKSLRAQEVTLAEQVDQGERGLATAREHLGRLSNEWEALRARFPALPEDIRGAVRYVRRLQALFDEVAGLEQSRAEVARKKDACERFEADGERLAMRIEEQIAEFSSLAAFMRHARERLQQARAAREQHAILQGEIAAVADRIRETAERLDETQAAIAEHQQRYRCPDGEALEELVERARAYQQLRAARDDQARMLSEAGDGMSVAALEAESAQFADRDVDTLRTEISHLAMRIADGQGEIDAAKDELNRRRHEFLALDGSQTEAADLAQEARGYLAEVDRGWNEYLRVELARRLLQRTVEDFRESNQSQVVKRASELFRRLTLGAYEAVTVEYDTDAPHLEVMHADGTRRRVEQLSDGTRDQLFLALRLAFLDRHLADSAPLPLIMDDILVHFDDARTHATLEILHEFSRRTQILYFTHHQAVVDAASTLAGPTPVHRLG